jgi:superfamily II DNA/RNA helicase
MKHNTDTDMESILAKIGIKELNEMQLATMAACKQEENVVLLSNTGTGKTLAFLLSVLDTIKAAKNETKVLIITPSRELAIQIEKVYKSLGVDKKITCCYGGHKREIEENNLVEVPAIIVGTPGRLADHIRRKNIKTATITTLILDEFDKLLEQNFETEMAFVAEHLSGLTQKILTSATVLHTNPKFVSFDNPCVLNYLTEGDDEKLQIQVLHCKEKDKLDEAFKLLCKIGGRSSIIFCNHRESVERVSKYLTDNSLPNEYYHGAMEQHERDSALCKFRNGTVYFLVTTDLASRGLDIPNIRNIIHYHLPLTEESFTHRNGRTARMDASGTAIVMLSPEEKLPDYINEFEEIFLPTETIFPEKPKWTTVFIDAGKKDKINKIDIVGFFSNRGQLKKEEIGVIEVKDFISFVAVKKNAVGNAMRLIKDQKIKNKKVKIVIAK